MDYRKAYEELSKALWKYDKALNDAYVNLMLSVREIDSKVGEPAPPISLADVPAEKPKKEP